MDSTSLRALQAPLKERYRDAPGSARTPLSASGGFTEPGVTCTVAGFAGPVRAGLHAATGGDGGDACSGDMLLEALVACAGVTLRSVATAMDLDLGEVTLRAGAVFDARGTLGTDRDVPVGIQEPTVVVEITGVVDESRLERLARTTERYCVVGQSLREPVRIVIERSA